MMIGERREMMMMISEKIEDRLNVFLAEVEKRTVRYFKTYENLSPDITDVREGRRYLIVTKRGSHYQGKRGGKNYGRAFAFIDKKTGDIFKPANLKAPAKHARGNLFDDDNGFGALDSIGQNIVYLR